MENASVMPRRGAWIAAAGDGLLFACLSWLIWGIVKHAWVAEDAYITYRVIDNFAQGHGLRWNIHERVQAYTHPLWMMLHIPLYAIWNNLFLIGIGLGVACTAGALAAALLGFVKSPYIAVVFFLLPLCYSRAFIDYATSGLENSLSYLLFALFGWVALQKQHHPHFWFWCSALVSLGLLNRLDLAMLYAPVCLTLAFTRHDCIRWKQIWLGVMPLLLWFAFSLFYYGFLFPNTKYAKLGTGFPLAEHIRQGLFYAWKLLSMDTVGPACILAAFSLPWLAMTRLRRHLQGSAALLCAFAIGIWWYCLYIVAVGGDYMGGRFWAVPIFASCWLIYAAMPSSLRWDLLFVAAMALFIVIQSLSWINATRRYCRSCLPMPGKIMDARAIFRANTLWRHFKTFEYRTHGEYHFVEDGKRMREETGNKTRHAFFIGMSGYHAGPGVPIIDENALADPLLARLPAARQGFWSGHFRRTIPAGYLYAVRTGSAKRMDPALARYHAPLKHITSGELWSLERMSDIAKFNLGFYDHWKEEYLLRAKP